MIPYMDLRAPYTVEIGIVDGEEILYTRLFEWRDHRDLQELMAFYQRLENADIDVSFIAELILEAS